MSGVERLASLRLFWMPVQQPALRAIGKPLLHCQIRHKHRSHHVRARHVARGLEIWMEISRDVQSPQALRPGIPTRVQGPVLRPPPCAGAAASDSRLDFQGVVSGFRDPSHEDAVPAVTVASLGEHRCITLVFGPLCAAANLRAANVAFDNECPDPLCGVAPGNIAEDLVEFLAFCSARVVHCDAPIFTEDSKVEVGVDRFVTDESRLRRRGR